MTTENNEQKENETKKSKIGCGTILLITVGVIVFCGMHNFGLPDAIVDSNESENPCELLRVFTLYLLSESPVIKDGQTFSVDSESPIYRIKACPPINYGDDTLFNNPFGMWRRQAC